MKIEQESVGFAIEKRSLSITEFCIREANAVAASSHQGPILFKGRGKRKLSDEKVSWTMFMGNGHGRDAYHPQ